MRQNHPIGIFDSGVGGLTVVSKVVKQLPHENIVYLGDTARVPYGEKTPQQIINFVKEILDFLLKFKVKAIIMACNTSSALAYPVLKDDYETPIFEMITPAVEQVHKITNNKRIGIIANSATVNSNVYKTKLENFNYKVFQQACPLLVPLVERGETDTEYTKKVLHTYLDPLIAEDIDILILGCTHYPHLFKKIKEIVGSKVFILNPAKFIVQKVKEYFTANNLLKSDHRYIHKYFVSGQEEQFKTTAQILFPDEQFDNIEHIQLVKSAV